MKNTMMNTAMLALCLCACATLRADLLKDVCDADRRADAAIDAIRTPAELAAKQDAWRAAWIAGLGGLPSERTPLNAKEGPVVACDGFTLQNVLFESQPGVYVVGHLFLPSSDAFKPPYPVVMMPLGHSDVGIRYSRYAAHAALMARSGLAAFAWDPIGQGERRQIAPKFDALFDQCAAEHARLGARGWLVGWNFARFRIWDAIRAVDYVTTRQEIDGSMIGVCGTSGGGTMSAYMQALDPRIRVAFPNSFVSSIRAVFSERGCHDAEQFFFGQLAAGVNHAAILAMGQPRVSLATGSRWQDYFPHAGAVSTFAVFTNLTTRLGFANPSWHFHCAGPHGLVAPMRAAQTDWMKFCLLGAARPKAVEEYWTLSTGDHESTDPASKAPLPFPEVASFFTKTGHVRDLPGFRSVYDILADRARELAKARKPKTRDELREIVRRRAGIRPLDQILAAPPERPYVPNFGWWYLKGAFGVQRENEAAMMSVLGRCAVGRDAEAMLVRAAKEVAADGGKPVVLRAKGWECIAAAHAYAAEPQLFSGIEFAEPPPSWTEMVTNPDPSRDSFAVGVWGALEEYDWPDLAPRPDRAGRSRTGNDGRACVAQARSVGLGSGGLGSGERGRR